MKRKIIVIILISYSFASFITPSPKTTKDFFRQKNWTYPLYFELPQLLKESKDCGLGEIPNKIILSSIQNNTAQLNRQIEHYFSAEFKADTCSTVAYRISEPMLCQLDTNTNVHVLVKMTEYNQSKRRVKIKENSIFSSAYKIENDHIYSISKVAIFDIKGDSLVFIDWWR